MRLSEDLEFENMFPHEVTERRREVNKYSGDKKTTELNVLIAKLKKYGRTWHLMMWHDSSSKTAHSHLLTMISCL